MTSAGTESPDVLVLGAGPAGLIAALRAARLGARTALVTRDALGGMAADDGPIPVRTLAHAARLMREARQLPRYGIGSGEPVLDYSHLLDRVREVKDEVRTESMGEDFRRSGVALYEHAGSARFIDPQTVAAERGLRLRSDKIIICTGGVSRRLAVPGGDLTCTHSDAWALSSAPASMLVVGAGATGLQVASIFNAFGSDVTLFEAAPRILMTEDEDVARAVGSAIQASGIGVVENGGRIQRFERCPTGVRMIHSVDGAQQAIDAAVVVVAVGWVANTAELDPAAAGIELDRRGFVSVDDQLRTTTPHIFAAGDVTGRGMIVHEATRQAYLAATNAVLGEATALPAEVSPSGSFTDPEYASVGLTEAAARQGHEVAVATQRFDAMPRPIIDGRPTGFCKLIVDRKLHKILGCHIVGERAVELAQLAAIAIAADMTVEQLALVPFSFPTYANALARAAVKGANDLGLLAGPTDGAVVTDVTGTEDHSHGE